MQPRLTHLLCLFAIVAAVARPAAAEDMYIATTLSELDLGDADLPERSKKSYGFQNWQTPAVAYVVLDHGGEVYMSQDLTAERPSTPGRITYPQLRMAFRAAHAETLSGSFFILAQDDVGMVRYSFTLDVEDHATDAKAQFLDVKEDHYRTLLGYGIPGAAHFRHHARQARDQRLAILEDAEEAPLTDDQRRRRRDGDLQRSFAFVTGGRALAENLPLDSDLRIDTEEVPTVDISKIEGITIPPVEWESLLPAEAPAMDPLAPSIPADQYALFFPSFAAMLKVIDEAEANGTPILQLVEPQAQDAHVKERYERQLCLQLDDLSRLLGPTLIRSVAFTGSDPYLRTGTDVAVLFEAVNPQMLMKTIQARQAVALEMYPGAEISAITVHDKVIRGVATPDRSICSYLLRIGNVVIVSNSTHQLGRLLDVAEGGHSIASLDEYTFFRQRYLLGDPREAAFLIATDDSIRRWASPRWRIGSSRRTRAAAFLSDLQVEHAADILGGRLAPRRLEHPLPVPGAVQTELTPNGVHDSVYGSLAFLTPIAELPLDSVTEAEKSAYEIFRRNYQNRWNQRFDPIAARLTIGESRLELDLSVMPLTARSDYNWMMQLTGDTTIPEGAGDPHEEALLHVVAALNPQSEPVRWANSMAMSVSPQQQLDLMSWIGTSFTFYVDDDPFFKEVIDADDSEMFLRDNLHRLPIAAEVDVSSTARATIFLAAVRAFVDQVAPGQVIWEPQQHGDLPYVKVAIFENSGGSRIEEFVLYYHLGETLVASLSDDVLKRALDRKTAKATAEQSGDARMAASFGAGERIGESIEFSLDRRILKVVEAFTDDSYQRAVQRRAFANLPILNEYKRLFPSRDPVEVYRELWGITLLCPAGGSYIWDKTYLSMQSTEAGHPGKPIALEGYPSALTEIMRAHFGLTFEDRSLRARAVLEREPQE